MSQAGRWAPARLIAVSLCFGALLALAGCGGTPETGNELAVSTPGQIGSNIITPPRELRPALAPRLALASRMPASRMPASRMPAASPGVAQQAAGAPALQQPRKAPFARQAEGSNRGQLSNKGAHSRMRSAMIAPGQAKRRAPKLIGLRADQVSSLLGRPTLRRREPPAQVWQYASADCVLYVFLYRGQNGTSGARVRYIESRDPATAAREPTLPCIDQFMHRRAAGDLS